MKHVTLPSLAAGSLAAALALSLPQPSRSQTTRAAESVAAFSDFARVAMSPRCQNCHTLTNFPRQGDDGHRHLFHVTRGGADRGAAGFACATCHGRANNFASGVPGAEDDWRLAPLGEVRLAIESVCRRLKGTLAR